MVDISLFGCGGHNPSGAMCLLWFPSWYSYCYSFHLFLSLLLHILLHGAQVTIAIFFSLIICYHLAVNFVAEVYLTVDGFVVGKLTLTGGLVVENTGQSSTISLPLLFTSVPHARED